MTIEGSAGAFISNVPWSRAGNAPQEATCAREDIEGDWHRSDGSLVPIVGVDAGLRDGGNALLFNHPEGWPRGQSKFRGIYRVGGAKSCKLKAICAGYQRSTNGNTTREERACELTIDPVRGILQESGSSLTYRRQPRGTAPRSSVPAERAALARAEAEAAKAREAAAEAERTASLNREVAERDAAIKRRNAEIKAADERRQREYRDALARQQAETERLKREEAAAKARYEADMAAWRARVAACKAGDYAQCQ